MAGNVEVRHLDLADLSSVRRFADSVETVDVLVNNAGVMGQALPRTADGFEPHMGTNYLGHFALTCLLGNKIKRPGHIRGQRKLSCSAASASTTSTAKPASARCSLRTRTPSWPWHATSSTSWPGAASAPTRPIPGARTPTSQGTAQVCGAGGSQLNALSVSRTGPSRRGPNHHSGGDNRPAERNVSRAAFPQTSGHTQGHRTRKEGSRPGHGPSAMGAIRRVDGLRLDSASPRADATPENNEGTLMDVIEPVVSPNTVEFDPFSDDFFNAPFNTYRRLRDEAPVYHNEKYGFWALSRYEDVEPALKDFETYSSARGVTLDMYLAEPDPTQPPMIIMMDPPEHTVMRKLVNKVFTPRAIDGRSSR